MTSPYPTERLTLLYGESAYLVQHQVDHIRSSFLAVEQDLNLAEYDGASVSFRDIVGTLPALPFLGTHRLIIIRHAEGKFLSAFAESAPEIPDHASIVIQTDKVDKRLSAFLYFKKHAHLISCEEPSEKEFPEEAHSLIHARGARLTPDAERLLILAVGTSLTRLDSELSKLLLAGRDPIPLETVRSLVTPTSDSDPFGLSDKLTPGKLQELLTALTSEFQSGKHILGILPLIISRARTLLILQSAIAQGTPESELASLTALHPFVVKKSLSTAKSIPEAKLIAFLTAMEHLESDLKHGSLGTGSDQLAEVILQKGVIELLTR